MNKQSSLKFPDKPDMPNPSECCDKGCENCVFVYYEKAVKRWEAEVEKIKKAAGV
jgi:Oxidoreductase-like protein, N-terminal